MYKALYREYRPETFEEVIGQETIVKILKNQIASDTVNHAYLFCGTRGTGKTTMARLLAKAVNCLSDENKPCGKCANCLAIQNGTFMDLEELDAASNNKIDDIRELRESVNYPPVIGRKKVFIIDEVHMLTTSAFNGFLKTLEEPPADVIFILATTEPQKLPQTILSRCIRMDFRRVSERQLQERMAMICQQHNVDIDQDALMLIAANADGSVRDGLTLLEQCISGRTDRITREEVLDSLGVVGEEIYIELTNAIIKRDVSQCILILNKIFEGGKDTRQVLMGLTSHYRNLLLTKFAKKPETILNMSLENVERIREQSEVIELEDLNDAIIQLSQTGVEMKNSTQPRVLLELVVVKLASGYGYGAPVEQQTTRVRGTVGQMPNSTSPQGQTQSQINRKPPMANAELKVLWENVCNELGKIKQEYNVWRSCTEPVSMDKGEIVVRATNSTVAGQINNGKQYVAQVTEKLTGVAKHIVVLDEEDKNISNKNIEEVAKNAEELLGINVTLE